ncbi:PHG31p119nc [Aeromonas phage 31]|uniref:PHG31p119nc n=1 Tax=Aeromonas phage 31 TaxID=321023 RepID=Q56EP2_9CAUD|nr:PHG31p119nc [Aeromonas phage 31]AAX63608.1 PHG31p119nc [Aeromonas phage 31]APU01014.1 hypothetical protein [Aeromonas phage 31.2]
MDLQTAYSNQKRRALHRGIEWKFTFESWLSWWENTGRINDRGRNKGQYVMCRNNDTGPYSPDNVYCGTHSDNLRDTYNAGNKIAFTAGFLGKSHSIESKLKISINHANTLSPDEIHRRIRLYNSLPKGRGLITNFAKTIGVSHTQARRFIKQFIE